jgi:hypothetical protein
VAGFAGARCTTSSMLWAPPLRPKSEPATHETSP